MPFISFFKYLFGFDEALIQCLIIFEKALLNDIGV